MKGADTGDIIYQERISISSGEKLEKVNQELFFVGAKLILKTMKNLETGDDIPRIKQPILSPTLIARKIKSEEYYGSLLKGTGFTEFLLRIKIPNCEKCDIAGYKIGTISKENTNYFFVCRDGRISVSIRPSTVNVSVWLYPLIFGALSIVKE